LYGTGHKLTVSCIRTGWEFLGKNSRFLLGPKNREFLLSFSRSAGMGVDGWSMTMDLQRIIAKFGRSESIAMQLLEKNLTLIAMQLLELIDYGPNTFGTHKESGGDSETIDENVR
jgi:hypothetical protein